MFYNVEIVETLKKTVEIEADSIEEAEQKASDNWHNEEYILDADNFVGVEFKATKSSVDDEAPTEQTVNSTPSEKNIVEWCPHCDTEITLSHNVNEKGYLTICPNCGMLLFLCSQCIGGEHQHCDWSEMGCYRCTPEMFLTFLTERYGGVIRKRSDGDIEVYIPLSSGVTVHIIYEKWGIPDDSKHFSLDYSLCDEEVSLELKSYQEIFALLESLQNN